MGDGVHLDTVPGPGADGAAAAAPSAVGGFTSSPAWPYWSGHYTVRAGDTLTALAAKFGVAKETLVACNESLSLAVEEPVAGIRVWKPKQGTTPKGYPGDTSGVAAAEGDS